MANTAGDDLFKEALGCEERGDHAEAKRLYERIVAEEPTHATAHVNLGTIFYNRRDFRSARRHYEAATQHSPRYALAHFNLANVLDEMGDNAAAIQSYQSGVRFGYVDSHYNLARLFEKVKQPRKAIPHWLAYMKADRSGHWHDIAKRSFKALLAADRLKLVFSNPDPQRDSGRAGLALTA